MRRRNLFLLVVWFFLSLPMTSWATLLTLNDAMLLLFEKTGQSPDPSQTQTVLYDVYEDPNSEDGVEFVGAIDRNDTTEGTTSWIQIGATLSVFQLSNFFLTGWNGYSEYSLTITNDNENTWDYALYTVDSNGVTSVSPWTALPVSPYQTVLTMPIGPDVTEIGFFIGGDVPLPKGQGHDYTFETKVSAAPVPEPATIMLMGMGLFGLGGWARRRHFKNNKRA